MIWHVRNNWKTSGRFCFNTYWHWKVLELRGNELTVHPKEGVTQGGPLDVIIYGLGVLTLIWFLHHHVLDYEWHRHHDTLQVWYANESAIESHF